MQASFLKRDGGRSFLRRWITRTFVAGLLPALIAVPFGRRVLTPPAEASSPTVISLGRAVAPAALPAPLPRTVLEPELRVARASGRADRYQPQPAPFELRVAGERVPHRVMAVVALPGERLDVALGAPGGDAFALQYQAGAADEVGPGVWTWRAPETPGMYALQVSRLGSHPVVSAGSDLEGASVVINSADGDLDGTSVRINVLVAHPRSHGEGERLHGYRLGRYRETPLRGNPAYLPPDGFVEVAPADEDVLVSPHFTIGQFLCKQPGEPQYLAVSVPLLLKLEAVLEKANAAGYHAPTLHVMSGFRTPAYNSGIGNETSYSRHLWGDAADVFVDADGDDDMDDLNRDGKSDLADARFLSQIVERVEAEGAVSPGGLGIYRRNAAHGPFVHVDARGYRARW